MPKWNNRECYIYFELKAYNWTIWKYKLFYNYSKVDTNDDSQLNNDIYSRVYYS